MKLLIDGYNVIFGCGLYGKHATADSLARGRQRLLQELTDRLPKSELEFVTVVFDAKHTPMTGQSERESFGPITVLYSIRFPDADAFIEQLLAQHPTPRDLKIVSSDHRLQNEARHYKAAFVDSDVWYFEELHRSEPAQPDSRRTTRSHDDGTKKEAESIEDPFPKDYLQKMTDEFGEK